MVRRGLYLLIILSCCMYVLVLNGIGMQTVRYPTSQSNLMWSEAEVEVARESRVATRSEDEAVTRMNEFD